MPRALKVCSRTGCPELTQSGRCAAHTRQAEQQRGSAHARGYGREHQQRFRTHVLTRDPLCVCTDAGHPHGRVCPGQATVADHHPRSKRDLQALGLDDNNPEYGRGLCRDCHDRHTAAAQPGGWHADRHSE